ncbi:MAG: biotin--[acetyl-CoA-carboxylase] ligase [Candidatus Asgardarchaeia archaeon]
MKIIFDWAVYEYEELNSTMLKAKELEKQIEFNKFAIIAKKQNAGYGRNQRAWYSPKGGLWVTLVLKRIIDVNKGFLMPYLISVAVAKTLNEVTGAKFSIKWPNDILIEGKKIAGILIETKIAQSEKYPTFFIGIGVNINNSLRDIKELKDIATSLIDLFRKKFDIEKIFIKLLKNINILMDKFITKEQDSYKDLFDIWKKYDITLGKKVVIYNNNEKIVGFAKDINYETGYLVLITKDKVFEIVDCSALRILEE